MHACILVWHACKHACMYMFVESLTKMWIEFLRDLQENIFIPCFLKAAVIAENYRPDVIPQCMHWHVTAYLINFSTVLLELCISLRKHKVIIKCIAVSHLFVYQIFFTLSVLYKQRYWCIRYSLQCQFCVDKDIGK